MCVSVFSVVINMTGASQSSEPIYPACRGNKSSEAQSHFYDCKQRNCRRFNKSVVDHLNADTNGDNQADRGLPSSQEDVGEPVKSSATAAA